MVELKTKTENRRRLKLPVVTILAVIVIGMLILTLFLTNGGKFLQISQEEFISTMEAEDFPTLILTYQGNLFHWQRNVLKEEIPTRLNTAITLFKREKMSLDEITALFDQLDGLKDFEPLLVQYREIIRQTASSREVFEYGKAALAREDFAGALTFFSSLKSQNFEDLPAGQLFYRRALDGYYQQQVDLADKKIKSFDFEEAKIVVSQLETYFPDDWRVKNLSFSCTDVELYEGNIQHLFYHPLIAYPELAFDKKGNPTGEDDYMVTVSEFIKVTQQLYDQGYVLIDINSLYTAEFDENGRTISVTPLPLYLPKGKKPYILSVDDINYYEYMKKDGHVYKLVVNENGDVITYSKDLNGKDHYSKDNEIVPILDQFVKDHPDASFNNAKGTLAVTGYSGVLGYRTDEPTWPGYEREKSEAKAVVSRLKETGWNFASHSQGHRYSNKISFALFKNDTDRWAQEVLPLVGPTSIYVYPFGVGLSTTDPKFDYLKKCGFAMFCTVSSNSRVSFGYDYALQGRRAVDGIAFRDKRLYDLLDVPSIIDPIRPSYAKWSQWAKKQHIIP